MRPGSRWWLVPLLLAVIVLTGVVGLLARVVYPKATSASALPSASAIVPSEAVLPLSEQPGSPTVQGTSDAVRHPLYEAIRTSLQKNFDAINAHDYDLWTETVTAAREQDTPRQVFLDGYDTVRDGTIVIYRIEAHPAATAHVLITFTSTQDITDAPDELPVPCINWTVVYAFTLVNDVWLLEKGNTSATPQHDKCEGLP